MALAVSLGVPVNSAPVVQDGGGQQGRMYTSEIPVIVNGVDRGHVFLRFFLADTTPLSAAAAFLADNPSVQWSR